MRAFRVWAPVPKKVELQLAGQRLPMTAGDDGWWTAEVFRHEEDSYGFFLDDAGPFPDPRSAWQPDGIHGLSRAVDHNSFRWTDAGWKAPPLAIAVIYELHVGTFTPEGTFDGAIAKLDYLAGLGVTHVEIMPVAEFSGARGWGYDGVDLFAPHQAYGGPEGLKRLVDACHARGLAVLLDVVYNHLGPTGNYLDKFGPYFSPRYSVTWGAAINFDGPDSDDVRRFYCDNALMWLRDYHFDGLRLDAVHAIFDHSAESFLEQLGREVGQLAGQLGRPLVLIAESDLNDPRGLLPAAHGGFGLDAQWSDDFHHALHTVLTGEKNGYYEDFGTLADICHALRDVFVYTGRYSKHRRRRHGRPPGILGGERFLGYLQNHDQIGNRAWGERSGHLMSAGRAKIGAALVFTAPFIPMLFQGEEWAASTPFQYFTDHQEPELGRAVSEGRRREFAAFGWDPETIPDPQARETFERSKLNWSEIEQATHAEMLEWHRQLIRLRQSEPELADGRRDAIQTHYNEAERWLVIERGSITVAVNLSVQPKRVALRTGTQQLLLASGPVDPLIANEVALPPDTVAIFKLGN